MTAHFVSLLDQLRRKSLRMASMVEDIVHEACECVFSSDAPLARRVAARDEEVDTEEVEVEQEAIRLMALYQPVGSDLRLLCTVLKVNNDLERISDCAVNLAERAKHLELQPLANRSELLKSMCPLVRRLLRNAIQAYSVEDPNAARRVLRDDHEVDAGYAAIVRQIIQEASRADIAGHLDLLSVAKNLERIADHATNIAEDVIFMTTGSIVRHRHDAQEPNATRR